MGLNPWAIASAVVVLSTLALVWWATYQFLRHN